MDERLLERTIESVTHGEVFERLPAETQARIRALSEDEVRYQASRVLQRPMLGETSQASRLLLNPCLAVQWLAAFEELNLPRNLRVFEPCTGSSEPVILAADIHSAGTGEYTALNLNRPLAAELHGKLENIRIPVNVIEEEAQLADSMIPAESVHIACFHHAVNDILQTAVSEPRGMDTRSVDWWANERQMIRWLAEDYESGRVNVRARPALIQAVRSAWHLVKPGGYLLFDHWTWEAHRDSNWLPWDLFCSLIPLARTWIHEEGIPLQEISLNGRDAQWWMCMRKHGG